MSATHRNDGRFAISSLTTGMVACLLSLVFGNANAAELRFAGVLGNSGDTDETLVTFAEPVAVAMGPVIDDQMTLWERGGATQLNHYALDGRLLGRFELAEPPGRDDHMTRVGNRLLMNIRKSLVALPLDAPSGSSPERLSNVQLDLMSSGAWRGKVAIYERTQRQLSWFDPHTGAIDAITKTGFDVRDLHVGDDGTLYVFGGGNVHAWKDGDPVAGFPKDFHGERAQKIGRYWYSHGWHGTIHRMNERIEPAPGVVLGGASGSFIGFLPQSVDVTNGRGMVYVRDDLYAISGLAGVVQLLQWNDGEQRFEIVRRIGALAGLNGVALDASGNVWTARGSWRWDASPEVPATIGDRAPDIHAQPVVLNGQTLCLLKKHYSYVQLAYGPLIDANGWSHLDTPGVKDFALHESITGAAAVPDGNNFSLVAVQRDGKAFAFGISPDGRQRVSPVAVTIPGLKDCTSLAWLGDSLYAADSGAVIGYQRDGDQRWKEVSRLAEYDGDVFIHSDGKRMAVSDTRGGVVSLLDSSGTELARREQWNAPTHVAVSGDRLVVYESGRQRLVKLALQADASAASPLSRLVAMPVPTTDGKLAEHTEADFQDLGRRGGIPFAVALTPDSDGLTVSIRTRAKPEPQIQLGVANAKQAYLLTDADANERSVASPSQADAGVIPGQFDFRLPAGDWSGVRLAARVAFPEQQERFGFLDHRAIHAPFFEDPALWASFDLENYREMVNARQQEIRITFEQPFDGKATLVIEDPSEHRIRNLVSGRRFGAGRHTVVWDGLDENGQLVAPGSYRWRGITHPGIEPVYRMNFANGGEETVSPWGPNHSTLQHAAANSQYVFFAAPVTEGGWALMALDADGNFVQGYDHQHGYGIQHDAIAADDRYLYCAQDGFSWGGTKVDTNSDSWTSTWNLTLVRYDIASGKLVEFPGKQQAIEVDSIQVGPGSKHPDLKDFNLGGLAVCDGKIYVGCRDKQAVLVLDAETGKQLDSIAIAGVRHLAAATEVYAATDRSVVRLRDGQRVIDAEELDIDGFTISPQGQILLSDGNTHQIHQFDSDGQPLRSIGKPGGPYKGAYDPARMVNPAGLVFGPRGKLWVTEDRWNPKRVLAWDLQENQVVYEKFGMPHYGGDGSGFDPDNPRRWIGLGCFWDVDIEHGTARPTHILSLEEGHFGNYEPHSYRFFREDERTFVCARGKISLVSEVLPDGTLHDLAAVAGTHHFAYGCNWDPPQAYIDAFYAKWPDKRAEEEGVRSGERQPWSRRGMGVLWVDRNGDGRAQRQEFDFCGDDVHFGDGAWGHMQTSLTLLMPMAENEQVKVVAIAPQGMLASGVPDYPTLDEAIARATPIGLTPGYKRSGVSTVQDRFGRFIFNSDPEMNAYQVGGAGRTEPRGRPSQGEHLWSYPNQWSNVHGSHDAPLPEPGVMQGTLGILGIAPLDDRSDVFFLNGNHGRCFLLSSDGLYLDEAFVDVRVSYLKNEYRLGGEIFGGSFDRCSSNGKYLVQIGHGPYRIYELRGLTELRRMDGAIQVTKEQAIAAQEQNLRRVAQKQVAKKASIPGIVQWDKAGKFRVELDLDSDETHLHLRYRVQDPSAWVNNGRDWTALFATGDSVDLKIATDPNADANRKGPVKGDKRLLIAPFEGDSIAVLYEHRKRGAKNPIEFTSPWRAETVDSVQRLPEARIEVNTRSGGYELKVSVPLADLGIQPKAKTTYRADFGVTFGDAEGTDANLRSYWSNQSTGLTDDIPGEIMLTPSLWGEVTFTPPPLRPTEIEQPQREP